MLVGLGEDLAFAGSNLFGDTVSDLLVVLPGGCPAVDDDTRRGEARNAVDQGCRLGAPVQPSAFWR